MRRFLPLAVLAVAACSDGATEQESADSFAARIGGEQGDGSSQPASVHQSSDVQSMAQAGPRAGTDVTKLEKLGDVAGVNFGPREGGCTFMAGENEMIVAAGLKDKAMSGKGVIRVGNGLVLLDSGPGGLGSIKKGTTFTGEGVTVTVTPSMGEAQTRPAKVTVASADGKAQSYSGNWICA